MSLPQLIRILLAHWITVCSVMVLALVMTVVLTAMAPRKYTASAAVMLDAKTDPLAERAVNDEIKSGYVSTQVDIASSPRVAQRAAVLLGKDKSDQERANWQAATGGRGDFLVWLGDELGYSRTVSPSRESSVINIAAETRDPKTAAAFANAFAQAYIDTTIGIRVDNARNHARFFDEQVLDRRAMLEAAQRKLADFQRDKGIVVTRERLSIEEEALSNLSGRLVQVRAERQASQSRQAQATGNGDATQEVLQSAVINNLKADLQRAEADWSEKSNRLGRNHPEFVAVEEKIASLKRQIAQESERVTRSLGSATQIDQSRESQIAGQLEVQKQRVLDLKTQWDQVAVLQNEVDTAQRALDDLSQRRAETSLASQSDQTNIVLLTPAVEPLHPSSPRVRHNLFVGAFLGMVAAIAAGILMELLQRRVRSHEDFSRLGKIQMLGRISRNESQTVYRSLPNPRNLEPYAS